MAPSLARATVQRPLRAAELVTVLAVALVAGTLYCAAWCRIFFYPMHDGGMPLWLSAWWAGTCLVPWLVAFELVKRLVPRLDGGLLKLISIVVVALGTALLTITAQRLGEVNMMGMHYASWSTLIANQMQPVVLFAALVGVWSIEQTSAISSPRVTELPPEPMPSLGSVEWIRAAGNYVELKCGERLLLRRMTMGQAEAVVGTSDFIRIHRSVIVQRRLIHRLAGSRIELTSGGTLPVGQSYRRAVERSVTSSQDSALRPICL